MEISGNTAFYAGLSSIQSGQNRVDQAASQIANTTIERSVTSQSSEAQVDRLRGVDRSQQMDPGSDMVQMAQVKPEAQPGRQGQGGKEDDGKVIWVHGWRPAVPECGNTETGTGKLWHRIRTRLSGSTWK